MSVIKKMIEFKCYMCSGKGHILTKTKRQKCKTCKGTGIYKESHYYFIDEQTGFAWSGDTIK